MLTANASIASLTYPAQTRDGPERAGNTIEVILGEGAVARSPHLLVCKGLGSCVAVFLYDSRLKLGGLAHVMLPGAGAALQPVDYPFRYADSAVAALVRRLSAQGARRRNLSAKLIGGACLFMQDTDPGAGIGAQNIATLRRMLASEGIPLGGEDVGGEQGRSAMFDLSNGRAVITTIGGRTHVI